MSQFHEFGTNFIRGENRGWILGAKFNICASCDWNHMSTDWGKFFVCKWFCRTEYTFTPSLSMLAIQHLYQHLTSILILKDYLGPSSHCDRSGICKTYCLDLLWVYKNSSSLTSPKKSYIICVIFLLGSCAANCHCFLQIFRAKYYDIYSSIYLRIMCGPQCCHVQRRRGRSLGAFWQHPPEPLWTKVFFTFVKILRKYCTWLIVGIPFGGIKNMWTYRVSQKMSNRHCLGYPVVASAPTFNCLFRTKRKPTWSQPDKLLF